MFNVGDIFARIGYRYDDREARHFERDYSTLERRARDPIEAHAGVDVDKRGFDRYDRQLHDAEQHSHRFGRGTAMAMGIAGTAIAGVGTAGVVGGALLAKSLADAASDINESLSKNRVLFGDYAKDIEKFAETSAKSYGIGKRAALEYTGVFGNLMRANGASREEASKHSVELTKLAADMASFSNTGIDEALDALRSGLVGETEPLRRFGVTLSANAVAAEAMRTGIVKTAKGSLEYRTAAIAVEKAEKARADAIAKGGKDSLEAREASIALEKAQANLTKTAAGGKVELTAQQKQMASMSLIMRQTSAAHGDFARTSTGAANTQRILAARFDDLKVRLGGFVLPLLSKAAGFALKLWDAFETGKGPLAGTARTIKSVGSAVGDIIGWFARAGHTVHDFFTGGNSDATAYVGNVRELVTTVGRFLRDLGQSLRRIFRSIGDDLADVAKGFYNIVHAVSDVLLPVIKRALPGAKQIIEGLAIAVRGVVRVIAGILNGDFRKAWEGVKDIVHGVFKAVGGIIRAGTAPIREGFARLGGLAASAFWKAINGVVGTAVDIVNAIIGVINKIPGVEIGKVGKPHLGPSGDTGGAMNTSTVGHYFAGGVVNAPIAIVGEEAPEHPEYIIPTNPRYRRRALSLLASAAQELGAGGTPGFLGGGILRGAADVVGDAAGAAGNVAGGLAHHLLGLLPANPFRPPFAGVGRYALDKAKDFILDKAHDLIGGGNVAGKLIGKVTGTLGKAGKLASLFGLRVSSTYRDPAHNRAVGGVEGSLHTHGSLANPGATDLVGSLAAMQAGLAYARSHYHPQEALIHDVGSGLHLHLGWFRRGGKRGKKKHKPPPALAPNRGRERALARGDRGLTKYDGEIADLERTYQQKDREFGLSDEDFLVEHDDGSITVDQGLLGKRVGELRQLLKLRKRIRDAIARYMAAVERAINSYRAAVAKLREVLDAAKGESRAKERQGYRDTIDAYTDRIGELQGVAHDLPFDAEDNRLDIVELEQEIAGLRGTAGTPATASGDDTGGGDLAGELGGGPSVEIGPDAQAQIDQANARTAAMQANLTAARASLAAFSGPGDIGVGGPNAFAAGTAAYPVGAGPLPAVAAAPAPGPAAIVQVHYHGWKVPHGHELQLMGQGVAQALDATPYRQAKRMEAG